MILDGRTEANVLAAAEALANGDLVGMPTETVYGLAADATSEAAVAKIFAAKGRPADHPLIVHVTCAEDAEHFSDDIPAFAKALMQSFWPGPLTLIVPRRAGVAKAAAGGQDSIGLRCPSHPVAVALLVAAASRGVPGVAAPSANKFGRVSPTTAKHVQEEFGDELLVLDGGACDVGIESTIVDCTRGSPVVLRPGAITRAQVDAVAGNSGDVETSVAPKAPGTLEAHYAPNAKVRLMNAKALQTALDVLGEKASKIAVYSRAVVKTKSPDIIRRRMPDDATETARQLFAVLREFDAAGVRLIWVELAPEAEEWDGVRDRLARAAAS